MDSLDKELVESPLQKLELRVNRQKASEGSPLSRVGRQENEINRASLYSFDSVSTTGRLLDRLDLDSGDLGEDEDDLLHRRESIISTRSTGRLLDRLELDDDVETIKEDVLEEETEEKDEKTPPMSSGPVFGANQQKSPIDFQKIFKQNPSAWNTRPRDLQNVPWAVQRNNPIASNPEENIELKNIKIEPSPIIKNSNASVESLRADLGSLNNSAIQLAKQNSISSVKLHGGLERGFLLQAKKPSSVSIHEGAAGSGSSDMYKGRSSMDSFHETPKKSTAPLTPKSIKTPRTPILRSASTGTAPIVLPSQSSPHKRFISESNSPSPSQKSTDMEPEARVRLATELRTIGKEREASYQLRLAASGSDPCPKAMYLYALALKIGLGVKQNDRLSLKWLCKCILVTTRDSTPNFVSKINSLEPEEMLHIITNGLKNEKPIDPNEVYAYFNAKYASNNKLLAFSKLQLDILSASLHETGNAILHGAGLNGKDENLGILYLTKAASLGYISSMVQLGDLLCTKSKTRKKNYKLAAAWLRLSELFGHKTIGNSWIYKEKYMPEKK